MPELHSLRAPEGHIKGAAFAEFVRWFGKRDPARLERAVPLVAARHAELDASAAGLGIIASRWYSAAAVHALLDALVGDIPVDRRQKLAFDGAAAIMDATLHGIYRMLFRLMATPERYAKHAPRVWTAYYDSGQDVPRPLCRQVRLGGRGSQVHRPAGARCENLRALVQHPGL